MPTTKKSPRQKARNAFINQDGTPNRQTKFLRGLAWENNRKKKAKQLELKQARRKKEAARKEEFNRRANKGVL